MLERCCNRVGFNGGLSRKPDAMCTRNSASVGGYPWTNSASYLPYPFGVNTFGGFGARE
jgi:hypothetical protein